MHSKDSAFQGPTPRAYRGIQGNFLKLGCLKTHCGAQTTVGYLNRTLIFIILHLYSLYSTRLVP